MWNEKTDRRECCRTYGEDPYVETESLTVCLCFCAAGRKGPGQGGAYPG